MNKLIQLTTPHHLPTSNTTTNLILLEDIGIIQILCHTFFAISRPPLPPYVADVIVERKSTGIEKSLGLLPENINGCQDASNGGVQVKQVYILQQY